MKYAAFRSIGAYIPPKIMTNADFEKLIETSDEWITNSTGIKEWRLAEDHEAPSDLGAKAAEVAIKRANISKDEIDLIICATVTPDFLCMPSTACLIASKIGITNVMAFDVSAACTGFVYILNIAKAFIESGLKKNVLIVGDKKYSSILNYEDRTTCFIFGDGAGAVVVSATEEEGRGIIATNLHSEGEFAEELAVTFPGTKTGWSDELLKENNGLTKKEIYPYMNGNYVFKHAVTRFPESIVEALTAANKTPEELDLFIPHQANLRISQFVQKQLGLPDEKVYNNIMRYGNTTAASIPIALSEAKKEGKIKQGDLVLMTAFGAGFTWGSVLMNW